MRDPETGGGDAALARFEACLFAEPALQAALARTLLDDEFVRLAVAAAAERGIALSAEAAARRVASDPLGLSRREPPVVLAAPPGGDWLPAGVRAGPDGALLLDWVHFADAPLAEPFFGLSLQRARARPLNRAFPCATPLAGAAQGRRPDGLIFHQSRCGSTLVSAMLGALPGATSVSEPAPVNAVVQLVLAGRLPLEEGVAALRAVVGGYGRRAQRASGPFFIKLDSWHSRALPLFRAAFPDTPWLFLFRDPVEILVSHQRMRGPQTIPEMMHPSWYGLEAGEGAPGEDYCARVLARIGEAALAHRGLGGGLFVDYAELPGAVAGRILPHFGIAAKPEAVAAMAAVTGRDAKAPYQPFAADAEAKRRAAGEAALAAVEAHMRPVFARLCAAAPEGAA